MDVCNSEEVIKKFSLILTSEDDIFFLFIRFCGRQILLFSYTPSSEKDKKTFIFDD